MTLPISMVIPCFRQEQWVKLAVDSVKEQSDDVTIIYDSGEHGHWKDYCEQCGYISIGGFYRMGVCAARNIAIERARNDLILCLDADDRLYPDGLQKLYDAWKPNTWCYGDTYTEIGEDESVIREMENPQPQLIFRKNLCFSTFLFHRDDWRKVGGFDPDFEPLEEDYGYQCALVNAGVKAVRVDNCRTYKRMIHTNSRTAKAMRYWQVTMQMCKDKYPGAFVV